jgi:isoleucyl-tRNA synthetase
VKNYTPPEKLIGQLGTEILRLWVAAEDYRNDIRFSSEILDRLKETYRKIRNTARFMLGNLYDFNPDTDQVPLAERPELDRWAIGTLQGMVQRLSQAYEEYEFHIFYHALNQFCTITLSSFYLDILKDRLYVSHARSPERRAAQTTLYEILLALTPLMAPVLSFTAEEIFDHLPRSKTKPESVYLCDLPEKNAPLVDRNLMEVFEKITAVRQEVLKALEDARKNKIIGHPLEAQIRLCAEGELQKFLQKYGSFWAECFIVSQVVIVFEMDQPDHEGENLKGLKIQVRKAEGNKCERCWTRSITVGRNKLHPTLCDRCVKVLEQK